MKHTGTLLAVAAVLGIGAYALSSQASPAPTGPQPGPKVPKQPLPGGKQPQDIPGDIDGHPAAVVTPPTPDQMAKAQSLASIAKASFQSETATAQRWSVSASPFGSGFSVGEVLEHTKAGHVYNPSNQQWEPNDRPQKLQALLHSNLADAVIRYAPAGPQWQDLHLPGVWYLVAQQA